MDQQNKLEIVTQHGWRKECTLIKGIIYIGSAPTNDVVLDERYGGGVAPLQVQLISGTSDNTLYKLINLGDTAITVGGEQESQLAPRSVFDLSDGQHFKLGQFTLVLRAGSQQSSGATQTSRSIGLKLDMPNTSMLPHQSLEGTVIVSNLGQRVGARFDLTLEGMEADCYDIAPGPLLSSGAEKGVVFRLHHLGHKPLAGKWRIVIRATCPDTYPGEQAVVSQVVQVLPYHHHRLSIEPARGIVPSQTQNTQTVVNTPKRDVTWDLSTQNTPPPVVTLKAGEAQKPALAAPDQTPTMPGLPAQPRPQSRAVPNIDAPQPQPAISGPAETESPWSYEMEPEAISPDTPAQKIKVTVPAQNSSPSITEKEEDWWGTS